MITHYGVVWKKVILRGGPSFLWARSAAVRGVGGFQLRQVGALTLRLKYESPEGWVTYSPELAMDFTGALSFRWSRT